MAEVLEHDADLLIASFNQLHFIPGIIAAPDHLQTRRRGALSAQRYTGAKLLFLLRSQRAFNLYEVSLRDAALCRRDGIGELAVVSQKDQAFTVIIKPPHRIHAKLNAPQQIENGGTALRI